MRYSGFTDVHCHVVPFVDDGADSIEVSQAMIHMAYKSGTRRIIATPHYGTRRAKASKGRVQSRFKKLEEWVAWNYPGMEMYLSQELSYHLGIEEEIRQGKALTMAESRYVLIEFHPEDAYSRIRTGLKSIQSEGYWPIVAHAERCRMLTKDIRHVEELVHMGVCIQVNASSITGDNGFFVKRAVKMMMKEKLVHMVGSDGHDSRRRKPAMVDAVKAVSRKFGDAYAEQIFIHNPECIIYNQFIER